MIKYGGECSINHLACQVGRSSTEMIKYGGECSINHLASQVDQEQLNSTVTGRDRWDIYIQ